MALLGIDDEGARSFGQFAVGHDVGAGTRFAFPDTLRSNEARTSLCPLDKIANSIAIDLAATIGSWTF
jgi:hypothetical protein